jgi:hypothetical protein
MSTTREQAERRYERFKENMRRGVRVHEYAPEVATELWGTRPKAAGEQEARSPRRATRRRKAGGAA